MGTPLLKVVLGHHLLVDVCCLSGWCDGTAFFLLGFVLFGGLALRLLAIGAQVLELGALGLGVVAAHLMGVVALGGIRSVCRRHPIAAAGSFSNY